MSDLKNILVKHLAGSHAYGTNTPESDVDYRGIFYTPYEDLISPFNETKEITDTSEEDTKFSELKLYINRYLKCNPNVVETLWVEPQDITFKTNIYDELRLHRKDLLSSKAAFTYTGYAAAQWAKMRNHYSWMKRTEILKPEQVDYISLVLNINSSVNDKFSLRNYLFGYRLVLMRDNIYGLYVNPGHTCWNTHDGSLKKENPSGEFYKKSRSVSEWLYSKVSGNEYFGIKKLPILIVKFNQKEYDAKLKEYQNLKTWEENRNPKRHQLELIHGFDTKNALHLVRLLRTGEEILKTGEVLVKRPDAAELLAIKNGSMSYEELEMYFNEKDKYIRTVLYNETHLPRKMNTKLANELSSDLHRTIYTSVIKDTTGK